MPDISRARRTSTGAVEPLEARQLFDVADPDRSFGTDGVAYGQPDNEANLQGGVLAAAPNGAVYVAAQHSSIQSVSGTTVGRFLPDGSLDRNFDGDGFAHVVGSSTSFAIVKMFVRPDGRLLVGGNTTAGVGSNAISFTQLMPDGSLDPSFGHGGSITVSAPGAARSLLEGAVLHPDGSFIAVGDAFTASSDWAGGRGLLVHFDASGNVDTAAAGGGFEIYDEPLVPQGGWIQLGSPVSMADGGFVVPGAREVDRQISGFLLLYGADGKIVPTFGVNGKAETAPVNFLYDDSRGHLYTFDRSSGTQSSFKLRRYMTDTGALDSSYGTNGMRAFTVTRGVSFDTHPVFDPGGRLLFVSPTTVTRSTIAFTRVDPLSGLVEESALAVPRPIMNAGSQMLLLANRQLLVPGMGQAPAAPRTLALFRANTFEQATPIAPQLSAGGDAWVIRGTNIADTVSLVRDRDELVVTVNGIVWREPLDGISSVQVATSNGNDTVDVADLGGLGIDVDLGAGMDQARIDPFDHEAAIRVFGGADDDSLTVVAGSSHMDLGVDLGAGSDEVLFDDSVATSAREYKVGELYAVAGAVGALVGIERAALWTGSGADTVVATPSVIAWTVNDNGAANDTLIIPIAEASTPLLTHSGPTSGTVTFGNRQPVAFNGVESVALRRPSITGGYFDVLGQQVTFSFDAMSSTLPSQPTSAILELTNVTRGHTFGAQELSLTAAGTIATLRLARPPGGTAIPRLSDGNYHLTVHAAAITDAAGNPFDHDLTLDFFVLAGDVDRDRVVDFNDLLVLAKQYGQAQQPAGAICDFDLDGTVDFDDLLLLAKNYHQSLAVPAFAIGTAAEAAFGRRRSRGVSALTTDLVH